MRNLTNEIDDFNEKAELVKKNLGLKKVAKALITLEKHPSLVNILNRKHMKLVYKYTFNIL